MVRFREGPNAINDSAIALSPLHFKALLSLLRMTLNRAKGEAVPSKLGSLFVDEVDNAAGIDGPDPHNLGHGRENLTDLKGSGGPADFDPVNVIHLKEANRLTSSLKTVFAVAEFLFVDVYLIARGRLSSSLPLLWVVETPRFADIEILANCVVTGFEEGEHRIDPIRTER